MRPVLLGALLAALLPAARAQEVRDGGEMGPLVAIAAIDTDARAVVEKQLALRGYQVSRETLDGALRAFAFDSSLDSPDEVGWVAARTLDELGAGHAIALRWGARGPRALELTADEVLRLNAALRDRGVTASSPRASVDAQTLVALREFQRLTGHPVQEGETIERRWLFILGVATEESTPRSELER
jgi:hypothetical protein